LEAIGLSQIVNLGIAIHNIKKGRAMMDKEQRIQAINEEIVAYREWLAEALDATKTFGDHIDERIHVKIVAEGDSWFNYIFGKDVVWWLRNKFGHEIYEVAYPGATLNHMAYGPDTLEFGDWDVSNLTQLGETLFTIEENRPRIIMLSGAGNDIAGPEFIQLIKHARAPQPGANLKVVDGLLDSFDEAYEFILEAIDRKLDEISLEADIIIHGYDLPFPNGDGLGLGPINISGPWFHESFTTRGYPLANLNERREVLNVFIERFNERLNGLALNRPRVSYLNLQGTLPEEDSWANELHPKNEGFEEIAGKFDELIQVLVSGDS
jgi:hypothetical protein